LPLRIEGDYGEVRGLAWWLFGGEIRFSCKNRILPGRTRTIFVRVPGEEAIPLEVMVRKASKVPASQDVATYLHKGSYRLLNRSDKPRLRQARLRGDPDNPVKAPTITGSVTPKRRKRSKTFPTGKALREALARGRSGSVQQSWWAPDGIPAVLERGESVSVYLDLSIKGRLERGVDRRSETLRFHLEPRRELLPGQTIQVVLQLPDHTYEQLEAVVERHHARGTVLLCASESVLMLPANRDPSLGD
jgi:hypothetical protein